MEFAVDAWMEIVTHENTADTPALRDTAVFLKHIERQPATLDKDSFFDFETVLDFNSKLVEPNPTEQIFALPSVNKIPKPYQFEHESQFPTVWRLHRLLEAAQLLGVKDNVLQLWDDVQKFRRASAAEQFAGLLWHYFHALSWVDIEKSARPASRLCPCRRNFLELEPVSMNFRSSFSISWCTSFINSSTG
jgi:hypothetical protein